MTGLRGLVLGCVGLALLSGPPAAAQEVRVPPESRTQIQESFAPVVKAVAPAVVNIYTRKTVTVRQRANPLLNDPFFRQFFGNQFGMGQSVPRERVERALGSGVIIDPSGVIVTNNHVIDGADEITVILSDRREYPATVVGRDPKTDIGVLRIDTHGRALPYLQFGDADSLEVGDLVLAIGNPFGLNQTVTSGIVSALARTSVGVADYGFFIQTDAAINPGNSGGALVDMHGRLVGLNSAIYSGKGGAGSIGIGFAIPSPMVRAVAQSLLAHGRPVRSWFGAGGESVSADVADSLGMDHPYGAIIGDVYPGSPAAHAGLIPGDIVLAINGRDVQDVAGLRYRLATVPVGDQVTLTVLRRGDHLKLSAKLMEPPETPPRQSTTVGGRTPLTGAEISNLNPALAEETGIPLGSGGVVISDIAQNSVAARLGFRPGDMLDKINRTKIDSVATALKALKTAQGGWRVEILRDGKRLAMSVDG